VTDPFVAEIRAFGFNFAPTGWAQCNGQLLPISQNTALFSLIGTFYGGDGKSTFALPDLQGEVPLHQGSGPGLSQRFLGEQGGSEFITLLQSETPIHTHSVGVSPDPGEIATPGPSTALARAQGGQSYQTNTTQNLVTMAPQTLAPHGGDLPHNNMMPYLTLNFCIALQGIFPPRS
jgi:microcystin-dependent protein